MHLAAHLAAIIAVLSTGVVYGTDAFCALVQRPALARVDDATLTAAPGRPAGPGHRRAVREPHQLTGTRAAAAGGFTTVVCMPNTSPPADNVGTIQFIKDAVERDAVVKVYPTGAITTGLKGQGLAPIGSLKRAGVVAIPHSVFYDNVAVGRPLVRFAFCKRDEVLAEAVERLRSLAT